MKKIIILIYILTILVPPYGAVFAADFTEHEMQNIKKAENYIRSLKTMSADFIQISPYNTGPGSKTSLSYGKLFLNRPGKARWNYNRPTSQSIIVNDGRSMYYDKSLDQISYFDIGDGLSSLLTNKKIDFFTGKTKPVSYSEDSGGYNLVLEDVKEVRGEKIYTEQLRLTFMHRPFHLKRFNFKDVNGRITTVELKNVEVGVDFEEELFSLTNPRIGKNAWEK